MFQKYWSRVLFIIFQFDLNQLQGWNGGFERQYLPFLWSIFSLFKYFEVTNSEWHPQSLVEHGGFNEIVQIKYLFSDINMIFTFCIKRIATVWNKCCCIGKVCLWLCYFKVDRQGSNLNLLLLNLVLDLYWCIYKSSQ